MTSRTLEFLHLNDYVSVITITAVVYDYFLMFSREMEFVWCRPWTWLSTVFGIVRYVGLIWTIIFSLNGSTFASGPQTLYVPKFRLQTALITVYRCTIIGLVIIWGYLIFLFVSDSFMILRVYALWNRSKPVLYILLFIYSLQVLVNLISTSIYYNPNIHFLITVSQVHGVSFCKESFVNTPSLVGLYFVLPRFVLGITLFILAVIPSLKESMSTISNATKWWQINRYMQVLVRDGILYFFVIVFNNILDLIKISHPTTQSTAWMTLLSSFGDIAMCNTMPRFLIDIRELYERDLRGRWQGADTGFGVISQPPPDQNAPTSQIVFADVTLGHGQTVDSNTDESEPTALGMNAGR